MLISKVVIVVAVAGPVLAVDNTHIPEGTVLQAAVLKTLVLTTEE